MSLPSDLEIARQGNLKPLADVASGMGLLEGVLEPYGESVAKIKLDAIEELADRPRTPICGDMRTMPGLSSHPALEHIDVDHDGQILGLS